MEPSQLTHVKFTDNLAGSLVDGSVSFPLPFNIATPSDIYFALFTGNDRAYVGRGDNVFPSDTPDLLNYTYQIVLERSASRSNNDSYDRSSVTFTWAGAGNPDANQEVTLVAYRRTEPAQSNDFLPNTDNSISTEQALDKLTRIVDENQERIDRSLVLPDDAVGEAGIPRPPDVDIAHLISYHRNDDDTYEFSPISIGGGGDIDIDRLRELVQRADADERGARNAQLGAESARDMARDNASAAALSAQDSRNSATNSERSSETAQGAATSASSSAQAASGSAQTAGSAATIANNQAARAETAESEAEAALTAIRNLLREFEMDIPLDQPLALIEYSSILNPLDLSIPVNATPTDSSNVPNLIGTLPGARTAPDGALFGYNTSGSQQRGDRIIYQLPASGSAQGLVQFRLVDTSKSVPRTIGITNPTADSGQSMGNIKYPIDASAATLDSPLDVSFGGSVIWQIITTDADAEFNTQVSTRTDVFQIARNTDGTVISEGGEVGRFVYDLTAVNYVGNALQRLPLSTLNHQIQWKDSLPLANVFHSSTGKSQNVNLRDAIVKYPERKGWVPMTALTEDDDGVTTPVGQVRTGADVVPDDYRLWAFYPTRWAENTEHIIVFKTHTNMETTPDNLTGSPDHRPLGNNTQVRFGIFDCSMSLIQINPSIFARFAGAGLTPSQLAKLNSIEAGAQVNRTALELKQVLQNIPSGGFIGGIHERAEQWLELVRDNATVTGQSNTGEAFDSATAGLQNVRLLRKGGAFSITPSDYTVINVRSGETIADIAQSSGATFGTAGYMGLFLPLTIGPNQNSRAEWELHINGTGLVKTVDIYFNNPFQLVVGTMMIDSQTVNGVYFFLPIEIPAMSNLIFRSLRRYNFRFNDSVPLSIPSSAIRGLTPGGGGGTTLTTDQLNAIKALVRGATIQTGSQDTHANPDNGFLVAHNEPFFDTVTEEVQDTDNWNITGRITPNSSRGDHVILGVFILDTNTTVPVTLQLVGRLPPFTGQHGTGRYTFDPSQTEPRAAGATLQNFAVINNISVQVRGEAATGSFYFVAQQREGTPDPSTALSVRRDTDISLFEVADATHLTTGEGITIGEVSLTPDDLAAINNAKLLVRDTAPVDDTFGETQWALGSQSYGAAGRAFNISGSTPDDLHFRVPRDFGVAHNSGASRIQLRRERPVENDDPEITFITDITLTDGHDEYFYGTYALSGSGAMTTIIQNDQFSIVYPNIRDTLLVQERAQTNAHAISRLRSDIDSIPSGGSSEFSAEQARKLRTFIDLVSYGTDVTDVWTRISANIASNNNMRRYGLYFHAANNISSSNQSVAPVQEFNDLNGNQNSRDFATAVCDSRNNTCRFYSHTHASGSVYGNAVSYLSRHVVSLRPPGLDFSVAGTGDRWQLILTFRYQINPNTPIGHNPEGADPYDHTDFVGLVRVGGNAQVVHNGALVDSHDAPISALNPQNNPNDDVRTSRFFLVLDPEHGLALNRGYREHARNDAVTTLPYSVRHALQTGLTLFPDNTNHGADHFANATRIEFSTNLGGQFSSNVATIHFSIQKYIRGTDPLAPTHDPFGAPLVGSSRINLQERTQSRGNDTLGGQTIAYGYEVNGGLREFKIDITHTGGAYFTCSFWYYTEPEQNIVRANNPLPLNVPNSLEAGRQFQVMMVISPDTFNDNTNTSLTGPLMSTRVFVDGTDYGWHNTWWRASDFNLFRIGSAGIHMGTSRTDTADMGIYSYESIPSYGDLRHMAARIQSYIGLWQHDHGEVSTVDIGGEVRGRQLPDSTESKALLSADNYNAYFGTPHAFLAYHSAEIPDSHFAGFELETGATWVDGMWNERQHANNRVLRYARAVQTRTGLSNTHVVTFTAIHRCRVEVTYSAESTEPLAIPLNETNPASCSLVISNATSVGAADRNAQQVHCRAARTGGILNMNTSVLLDIGDSIRFAATGDQRHIRIHVQGFRIF